MERNQHLNTRLGHPHHDIVADDGSVAVPRHVSSFDVTQVPAYNRCDSGYEAGYKMDPYQSPAKSNVGYSRLDSGIDSEFNSLSLEPRSSVAGASPLHSSTSTHQPGNNETEFIEELFEQDAEGDTQLHLAIASSYEDVVNALVRLAPKPDYLNIQNNELYAPLHIAVLTNQPSIVRRLVVAGAATHVLDQEGNTPLHHACSRGNLECAENLLRPLSSEEVQHAGSVSLESNHLHEVLDHTNHKGEHAVHLATFGRHRDILWFLCCQRANMNATEGRSGKTALHYAVNMRDETLVQFLAVQCRVELNTRDWAGRTPIQCSMINGDEVIVGILKSLGADMTLEMESEDSEDIDEDVDSYNYIETSRIVESQA